MCVCVLVCVCMCVREASLVICEMVLIRLWRVDLSGKLDHSRVVSIVRTRSHLPLIQKYLLHVQHEVHRAPAVISADRFG